MARKWSQQQKQHKQPHIIARDDPPSTLFPSRALFGLGDDEDDAEESWRMADGISSFSDPRTEAIEHPLIESLGDQQQPISRSDESIEAADMRLDSDMPSSDERRPVNAPGVSRHASYGGATPPQGSSEHLGVPRPSNRSASSYHAGRRPPSFLSRNAKSMRLASEVSLGTGREGDRSAGDGGGESGPSWRATAEGTTPLDRTIDAIGMGTYQYAVLILTGCGWAADNMWLQGVAITLPRIQDEWAIQDQWIGLVSSSTFAGMMIGALAWGSYADSFGRVRAFNATLLITAVFGLLSTFAPNFPTLCLCLFLLGTGVGGSMPTDGTIFLEVLPKRFHYLVTALSVFFAAGSVVTSVLGLVLVPSYSCGGAMPCLSRDNRGWRYLLASLAALTLLFVVARIVFFTLLESPKYLVSAGKHEEARAVLQRIAAFNGDPKRVRLADVSDNEPSTTPHSSDDSTRQQSKAGRGMTSRSRLSEDDDLNGDAAETQTLMPQSRLSRGTSFDRTDCDHYRNSTIIHGESNTHDEWPAKLGFVPLTWRSSLRKSASRYSELFLPEWKRTTILVWLIWTLFTLAYTMVNVFLPKYLESRTGGHDAAAIPLDPAARRNAMAGVLREFVFYSLASLPGSLLGAWLIETPLGRIKSMALSTAGLALSLLAFALLSSTALLVIMSSCAISLFASIAYAVIYSYSPEVFATSLRGTACGTASALSRLAGIVAPVLAGALMQLGGLNLPLYVGFALFGITVWLEIALPIETRGRQVDTDNDA